MSEPKKKIPLTTPDRVNITTHPMNSEKARARYPLSEKKVSNK
jgi:hypothetical protein